MCGIVLQDILLISLDILAPPFQSLGLFKPQDPTFGRYLLPPSHTYEVSHSDLYKDVKTTRRRLYITRNGHAIGDSHAINLHERELLEAEHDNWVTFQTFEKTGRQPNDVDADLLLIQYVAAKAT